MNIKISNEATTKLSELLKEHSEYNCIRFSNNTSHCGHRNVEVVLDELDSAKNVEKINDLTFMYDNELKDTIMEIELVFKNNGFAIKTIPIKQAKSGCSSKGCSGSCCSSCGK